MSVPSQNQHWPVQKYMLTGALALVLLLLGFGGWLATANLSGAVILQGLLARETANQQVQHAIGGVVDAMLVTEGQRVQANEILIQLNEDAARSDLAILNGQYLELRARHARLIAQRDGHSSIDFPPDISGRVDKDTALRRIIAGQVRLFETRQISWSQQQAAATTKIAQITIQITGTDAQLDALKIQQQLLSDQLNHQDQLLNKGLATANQLRPLQRQIAIVQGKTGQIISERASAKARIAQIEIEVLQTNSQRREDTIAQLRDMEFRLSEIAEKQNVLQNRIDALKIRAQIRGVVLDLGNFGTNSVINPAQVLMQIAPAHPPRRILAKLTPADIEQVYLSQPVDIRFSTVAGSLVPRMPGQIIGISAGTLTDVHTGAAYFRIEVSFDPADLAGHSPAFATFTGMPVDLYIQTTDQRAWAYLAKPFLIYFSRALRES